jgi:hypothetical protein
MSLIGSVWECNDNWGGGGPDEYNLAVYNFSTEVDYTVSAGNRLLLRMTAETTNPTANIEFLFMYDSIDVNTLNEYKAHLELPLAQGG